MDCNCTRRSVLKAGAIGGITGLAGCQGGPDQTPTPRVKTVVKEPSPELKTVVKEPTPEVKTVVKTRTVVQTPHNSMDGDPEDVEIAVPLCPDEEMGVALYESWGRDVDDDGDYDVIRVVVPCPDETIVQPQTYDIDGNGRLEVLIPVCSLGIGETENRLVGDVRIVHYGVDCNTHGRIHTERTLIEESGGPILTIPTCELDPGATVTTDINNQGGKPDIRWVGMPCE